MRIVEANPEKPIRTVNMVGYGWLIALTAAYLLSPSLMVPLAILLAYPVFAIPAIIHVAWYTPNDWEKPFFTSHYQLFIFFCIPLFILFFVTVWGTQAEYTILSVASLAGAAFLLFLITHFQFTIVYIVVNRLRCFHETSICKHCGYNLTGNISGICPECGKPLDFADRQLLKRKKAQSADESTEHTEDSEET